MFKKFLILYLVALAAFGWGYGAMRYGFFPGSQLADLESRLKSQLKSQGLGDSVPEPIAPDSPSQPGAGVPENQLVGLHLPANRDFRPLEVPGINSRRTSPLVFAAPDAAEGYRLIFGAFDVDQGLYGALLLDPGQRVIKRWTFSQFFTEQQGQTGSVAGRPRSIAILDNGSVIVGDDNRGSGLFRVSLCGELEWFARGHFNDVVQVDHEGDAVWTLEDDSLVSLDAGSGERLRTITLNEIHLANPDVAVFTPRRSLRVSKWYHDPVHTSDVEPLPGAMEESFPGFNAGDLLVSYRSLNLVLILDPETLEIKWWRTGIGRRQTDADWNGDGWISIFNNNRRDNRHNWDGNLPDPGERYSGVMRIAPDSGAFETAFDGAGINLYSSQYGKHQFIPGGNLMVTSPEQGRVVEISGEGAVVFDFINRYSEESALRISDALWLPPDFFTIDPAEPENCPRG